LASALKKQSNCFKYNDSIANAVIQVKPFISIYIKYNGRWLINCSGSIAHAVVHVKPFVLKNRKNNNNIHNILLDTML
jgi:hypothetical protein